MSCSNPPNVIIDMYVVESVLEAGLFSGMVCIITLYKEQATMIRQALWLAGTNNL